MLTRDVVSANINALKEGYAYVFFDNNLRTHKKAIDKYVNKGIVTEAASLDEMAETLGMDADTLKTTIAQYNAVRKGESEDTLKTTIAQYNAVRKGESEDTLGRETGLEMEMVETPFFAIKVSPGIHHTMGGVHINTNAEVINTEGNSITGLWAAGEVTGGVHGANRLGGNAVADIVIFGRVAGSNAGTYAMENDGKGHGETVVKQQEEKKTEISEEAVAQFQDGTYTATYTGNNGDVVVTAVVENDFITQITTENEETPMLFKLVQDTLIPEIIYTQSTDVDTISGSTMSSKAVINAMNDIMEQAKQ